MKRLILLLMVFAAWIPGPASAGLLGMVIDAANGARKLADKVPAPTRAAQALRAAARSGDRPLHTLHRADGKILATDAAGREVLLAAAAAGGAFTLTGEGAALLRAVDLVIPEADLPDMAGFLKQATELGIARPVRVLNGDGTTGRVLVREATGKKVLMAEKYRGVFLEVAATHSDELAWALQQPLQRADIQVVSLFDKSDADVLRRLDDSVGELHRPGGHDPADSVVDAIRSQKQKSVFVVGHVEDEHFVIRDADGVRKGQVPIADLEQAARDADSTIFMLGCSTGLCPLSSGPMVPVNALDMASGLKRAIQQKTIGDALAELAEGGDMLVKPDIIDSVRTVIRAEERSEVVRSRSAAVVRVGVLARARSEELASRLIPLIPSWVQFPYLVGLVALLFSVRKIWREWRASRLPAPRFGYRPVMHLAVHGLRIAGFILLMPFAAFVSVCILFSSWYFSLLGIAELSPVATAIAAIFGWRLWRTYREQTAGEPWFQRFWIILVFCAVVPGLVMLIFYSLHDHVPHQKEEHSWLLAIVPALLAVALSWALLKLLRRIGRNPNELLHGIMAAPLTAIEMAATRLITRTGRNEIAR